MLLPDLVAPGLRVIFCGTAAGTTSALESAYYAGPQNQFWSVLHSTGLTPVQLRPAEFRRLTEWGIGLTDVCKSAAGMDREIPSGAFDPARLEAAVDGVRPDVIAFNGKTAARLALGLGRRAPIETGPLAVTLGETPVWVLPSTAPTARRYWDVNPWQQLAVRLASALGRTSPPFRRPREA